MSKKPSARYEPKPLFLERMHKLLPEKKDYKSYLKSIETPSKKSFRCNTLKISPEELKSRLEKKGWKIYQPFKDHPEIFIVESNLEPGELGRSLEHQLGYYYVQEISSMMPVISLDPQPGERILDLAASPGSKTTQIASKMQNTGTIIANDKAMGRIQILATNLERCGVSNAIITKKDGAHLSLLLKKKGFKFDRILIDAPCSGEGTFRSTPKGMKMWNINSVKNLNKIQKNLISHSYEILKDNGIMVYSTCTHAPEENETIIDFAVKELKMKVENISLPIKCRQGIIQWEENKFDKEVEKSCRIFPQDTNTDGFFIARLRK